MEPSKLEAVAKMGLSVTTLGTVVMFWAGSAYYWGFLEYFNVPIAMVQVSLQDILTLKPHSIWISYAFSMGYLWARELRFQYSRMYEDIVKGTEIESFDGQPLQEIVVDDHTIVGPDGRPARLRPVDRVALWLLSAVTTISIVLISVGWYLGWYPGEEIPLIGIFFHLLGWLTFFGLRSPSFALRAIGLAACVGLFIGDATISGGYDASRHNVRVTIELRSGEKFEQALLIYRSASDLVFLPEGTTQTVITPASDLKRIVLTTKWTRHLAPF